MSDDEGRRRRGGEVASMRVKEWHRSDCPLPQWVREYRAEVEFFRCQSCGSTSRVPQFRGARPLRTEQTMQMDAIAAARAAVSHDEEALTEIITACPDTAWLADQLAGMVGYLLENMPARTRHAVYDIWTTGVNAEAVGE